MGFCFKQDPLRNVASSYTTRVFGKVNGNIFTIIEGAVQPPAASPAGTLASGRETKRAFAAFGPTRSCAPPVKIRILNRSTADIRSRKANCTRYSEYTSTVVLSVCRGCFFHHTLTSSCVNSSRSHGWFMPPSAGQCVWRFVALWGRHSRSSQIFMEFFLVML